MGQYYKLCNIDKKQYIHPHKFGDGLKLMEFGQSGYGTMMGLAVLLADGNNRGGGDLRSENTVVGSWAGDRIVITGDYADEGRFVDNSKKNLYAIAEDEYTDISVDVLYALLDDKYIYEFKKMAFDSKFFGDPKILQDLIKIKETKPSDLPLLIGSQSGNNNPLQTDDGRSILEQEIKRRFNNDLA